MTTIPGKDDDDEEEATVAAAAVVVGLGDVLALDERLAAGWHSVEDGISTGCCDGGDGVALFLTVSASLSLPMEAAGDENSSFFSSSSALPSLILRLSKGKDTRQMKKLTEGL